MPFLNNIVKDDTWSEIKNWVTDNTFNISNLSLIGTGGNINKIHKISSAKDYDPIIYYSLSNLFDSMNKLTYKERIIKYQLNPDRADVILPALSIYLKALKWSGSKKIYVPKRPGEPDRSMADIKKIKRLLKWSPKITIKEGINELLNNINNWSDAPVWTPKSIKKETRTWFKLLKNK